MSKIRNEARQRLSGMSPEQKQEYYAGFLSRANACFKVYVRRLAYAGVFLLCALLSLIIIRQRNAFMLFVSPAYAVLLILLAFIPAVMLFVFKLEKKGFSIAALAVNAVAAIILLATNRKDGMTNFFALFIWLAVTVFNLIAAGKFMKRGRNLPDGPESKNEKLVLSLLGIFLILAIALLYNYAALALCRYFRFFELEGLAPNGLILLKVPVLIFLSFFALIFFVAAVWKNGINAFTYANICKDIKGSRQDGTKKIFWATIFPVINMYSAFIFIMIAVFIFGMIFSLVTGSQGSNKKASPSRTEYSFADGETYYVEGEILYDAQNRAAGRVINSKVYNNNMDQIGYISGDTMHKL